jgi:hypothetical protein
MNLDQNDLKENIGLSDKEKIEFANEFLERFLEHGFGTMIKREIEILIFKNLYQSLNFFESKRNHDIANNLKISETKVKTLIMEMNLKYPTIGKQEALKIIAKKLFETYKNKVINDDKEKEFRFVLEDPFLKREFEDAAKIHGYFADGSFNSEIVRIAPIPFIRIFLEIFKNNDKFQKAFKDTLEGQVLSEKVEKKIINSNKSLSEKIEIFLSKHENKLSLAFQLISIANPLNLFK